MAGETVTRPKKIGVIANVQKSNARARLEKLLEILRGARGIRVHLDAATAKSVGEKSSHSARDVGKSSDVVVVLGGDGTILRVVRELEGEKTAIFGVNLGSLGFLTTTPSDDLESAIGQLLSGKYRISVRSQLQTRLRRGGQTLAQHHALNDFVVAHGEIARIVRLQAKVNGEFLTEYVCDGMIFSTPTGSTAYSLSAGGPILSPDARAFVMTPICAHALSNRPLIVADTSRVTVRVASAAGHLKLTVDGQLQETVRIGDELEVKRSARTVRLVELEGCSYYDVLRQKLKWSGATV